MAFRRKAKFIVPFNPDILIVQECEHPDKLLLPENLPKPMQSLWFGRNKNKGLGIFTYSNYRLELLDVYTDDFKMIVPIAVAGQEQKFNLLAVWAYNPHDKDGRYITQVWKAIKHYDKLISETPAIIIGDFNSNVIWDAKKKSNFSRHASVVSLFEEKGILSIYHLYHNQIQGKECHATFHMYRHKDKPYHIDYCFASSNFVNSVESVEVGAYEQWANISDHSPLIVTFKD